MTKTKKRYIALNGLTDENPIDQFKLAARKWFGESGLANLELKEFPELSSNNKHIIRISRSSLDITKALIALSNSRSLIVSGSISKVKGRI